MQIKDILAKIGKGETLNDEERAFAGSFDLQTQLDAAASSSRKRAEAAEKAAKDALAQLQAEFDDYKAENDPSKKLTEIQKLTTRIEKLEADKKAAEDKLAASERSARVRSLAKEAGIVAAKGIDTKTIDLLVDNLMSDVDLEDGDAVKAAFDGFKASNAGLIAAATVGGAGQKGTPGGASFTGPNPFAKETFNLTGQMELRAANPALAKQMQDAAQTQK